MDDNRGRRIDVLAIGLFGLAVGALTLGVAQLGWILAQNTAGALVIAFIFGGVVQLWRHHRYSLQRTTGRHRADHVWVPLAHPSSVQLVSTVAPFTLTRCCMLP